MMMQKTLYMPSTPLNLLVSVAHALHFKTQQTAQLWLIDQKPSAAPYLEALKTWHDSPFEQVEISYQASKGHNKYTHRKQLFRQLNQQLHTFLPHQVAVGSDRRVEFQYVMHRLSETLGRPDIKGIYLDDGLYSYAGRPYKWYKDAINALLKKIAYGFWWQEPPTVGASPWIDEAWLFQPQNAVSAITQKSALHKIAPSWFQSPVLKQFSSQVLATFHFDAAPLNDIDIVIFIPHPNNISKMQGYEKGLIQLVNALCRQGSKVAVKYHPRMEEEDYFSLKKLGIQKIIPSQLASEFILPALKQECLIVGDVGTALLTAKWIRPELQVYSLLSEADPFQQKFIQLMQKMDIHVIQSIKTLIP
ncbi:polysialyltransferase family glycosyltransferase [Galenea microaerophila]